MQYIVLYALALLALMYLFIVIPGKKKHRVKQEMLRKVAPGDRIITMGGIVAEVLERERETLVVKLMEDGDCRMRILIYAVQQVVKDPEKEVFS